MNSKKFIQLAKENNFEASEIVTSKSSNFSFSLFHGEIDSYSVSTSSRIIARGIVDGKIGFATTEKDDNTTADYLTEKEEKPIIFKGSKKYHRKNTFSKALVEWKAEDKIDLLHKVEEKLKSLDKRVSEVEVAYSERENEGTFVNSYGLNLKQHSNYASIYASAVVKDGEEIKTYGDIWLSDDPSTFDLDKFCEKIVKEAVSLLHGTTIKAKKYKAVLNPDVVSSLLGALLSSLDAEEVQKHSSFFEGKLNQQVLSKKITIDEKPLTKNCFFTYFDDEGVACVNKKVFSRGKLLTYFHNLETAEKAGCESTGNAARRGAKMGIDFVNIVLKPGKLTEDELFSKIKDGVYITDVAGLHAGLNAQSGDFSLQAQGYHVKDGKKSGPLTLITVAGNLLSVFNDVIALGNNTKLSLSSINCPSIAIKNLKVSAE